MDAPERDPSPALPRLPGPEEENRAESPPRGEHGASTAAAIPLGGGSPLPAGDLAGLIARHRDRWCIRREDGMYRAYGRSCDEDGAVTYTGTEVAASSIQALDGELAAREVTS